MVHIVITSWAPLHKIDEVQKKYTKTAKELGTTATIKSVNVYNTVCKKGGKTVAYHEVEEGNLEEALVYLSKWMQTYHDIKGFSYEFTLAVTPAEMTASLQD